MTKQTNHDLCSFLRNVLTQGAAIQQDYQAGKYANYEEYAIRIDDAARERRDEWMRSRAVAREAVECGRPGAAEETAWLVERHDSGQIEYLYFDEGLYWTSDSLKACRFSRRADAEQAASGGELYDLHIVEHRWVKP